MLCSLPIVEKVNVNNIDVCLTEGNLDLIFKKII